MAKATQDELDPFSKRVLYGSDGDEPGIWRRWLALQAQHRDMANKLWAGMVATEFTDHELQVLDQAPISQHDRTVMAQAGRPMRPGRVDRKPRIEFGGVELVGPGAEAD